MVSPVPTGTSIQPQKYWNIPDPWVNGSWSRHPPRSSSHFSPWTWHLPPGMRTKHLPLLTTAGLLPAFLGTQPPAVLVTRHFISSLLFCFSECMITAHRDKKTGRNEGPRRCRGKWGSVSARVGGCPLTFAWRSGGHTLGGCCSPFSRAPVGHSPRLRSRQGLQFGYPRGGSCCCLSGETVPSSQKIVFVVLNGLRCLSSSGRVWETSPVWWEADNPTLHRVPWRGERSN